MRPPIGVREVASAEQKALETLYHETKDVRIRQRVQIILLASEHKMIAPQIASIVRTNDQTVRTWIKRFNAEGIAGLYDHPRSGAPAKVTAAYRQRLVELVRRRPRAVEQPYSLWTLQRLADFLGEESGIRVSKVTVAQILADHGIVLSRPQHKVSSPDPEYELKKRRLKTFETTSSPAPSSTTPTSST
jgi:transposase